MSSLSEFSVDLSKFYQPEPALPDTFNHSIDTEKDLSRFFYVESADEWLEEYQKEGKKRTALLNGLAKTLAVITALISVLMPLAIWHLSAWIPWGIGLPCLIILPLIQAKLKERIDLSRRNSQFVPFFKEFLNHDSLKSLHPLGEWDLPPLDKRLKSDLMMQKELKKKHPKSGKEIVKVIKDHDLEITSWVQNQIACSFAQNTLTETKWRAVQKAIGESVGHFQRGDLKKCEDSRNEAFAFAYEGYDDLDFSPASAQAQVKAVVMLYYNFCRPYPEVAAVKPRFTSETLFVDAEHLLKEVEKLYAPFTFLEESLHSDLEWPAYLEFAKSLKKLVAPLIELLEKRNPEPKDFLLALEYIRVSQLHIQILDLIDQTRQIKIKLKKWIEAHPSKELGSLEKKFEEIQKKGDMRDGDLAALKKWIEQNPAQCRKKCIHVYKDKSFPPGVRLWLKQYPKLRFEKPATVYDRALKIKDKVEEARLELTKLQEGIDSISSKESYDAYILALETFKRKIFSPLNLFVCRNGEASKIKIWLKAFLHKSPAYPFTQEKLPRSEPLRMKKIEEIRLNRELQKIDAQMVRVNRVRVGTLRMPFFILLAIEAIFFIFFPTPWFFWGCSLLTLMAEGISYYIDYRLRQMDKKKQSIKLQSLLLNHPDVGAIPGTKLRLKELKHLQGIYGLEGVRVTWARALAENEDTLPAPKDLKSAKKMLFKLCKEGSQKATTYLKNELILLSESPDQLVSNYEEVNESTDRIDEIEKSLKYVPQRMEYPKAEITAYERLIRTRNKQDSILDEVVQQINKLETKKQDFIKQSKKYVELESKIANLQKKRPVWKLHSALIAKVMEKKQEEGDEAVREACLNDLNEQIAAILKEISPAQLNRIPEENREQLRVSYELLQAIPTEDLFLYYKKLESKLLIIKRLKRALKRIEKCKKNYRSKEFMDQNVRDINKELEQLEQRRMVLKENYKSLTRYILIIEPMALTNSELNTAIHKLELQINDLEKRKSEHLKSYKGLDATADPTISAFEKTLQSLREKCLQLETERTDLIAKIQTIEPMVHRNVKLNTAIHKLELQINDLEKRKREHLKSYKGLDATADPTISAFEKTLQSLREERLKLETERTELIAT